ncbi:MAG TPA: glycosyltransferase family 39 protein, partial [bacterium]|nr:glycosyltransferase family 39 protein [bacterium]
FLTTQERIPFLFLALVASLLTYGLLRRVVDETAAVLGVLLLQVTPLFAAGAVLILHDSLLLAIAAGAWWLFAGIVLDDRPRGWPLLGVLFALGLYAKFSMVIVAVGFFLALLTVPRGRAHLRTPWPYLGALATAVLFAPVVLWNMKHDWIAQRAVGKLAFDPDVVGAARLASFFDFLGGQLGVITPVLAVVGFVAAIAACRERRDDEGKRLLLAVPGLTILAYFAVNAWRAKIQANWPAVAWLALAPLAVDWTLRRIAAGRTHAPRWLAAAALTVLLPTIVLHVHVFRPLATFEPDIAAQFYGYDGLAEHVDALRRQHPQAALMTKRYQTASELVYYLSDRPTVYTADFAHRGSQFTLDNDWSRLIGRDVLYVDEQAMPGKLQRHFASVAELAPYVHQRGVAPARRMRVYLAQNMRWAGPLKSYFEDPVGHQSERMERRKHKGE